MSKDKVMQESKNTDVTDPKNEHFINIPGMEGVEKDMLLIPRLKLVQKSSEEIMEFDYKPGTLCDSVTKEIVGQAPKAAKDGMSIEVVPILVSSRTRLMFNDFDSGGGLLCKSNDGKHGIGKPGGLCRHCVLKDWVDQETPKCTDYINVFFLIPEYDSPIPLSVSFGRTSIQTGKKLINFIVMKQQSPWNFKFKLYSSFIASEKGDHFVFKITPDGKATEEEKTEALRMYEMLSSISYEVDEDEPTSKTTTEPEDESEDEKPVF